jgi:phosphoribosylformylglycinamidine (FGAM) synthase-like enzyme
MLPVPCRHGKRCRVTGLWPITATAAAYGKPERIASPLQIMIEGPLGGAAFNNEFGRPNWAATSVPTSRTSASSRRTTP